MEALVSLELSELKWLEHQMRLVEQRSLHHEGPIPFAFMTGEMVLGKVLLAFSEKCLNQEDENKLSFLTLSEGAFT